MTILALKCQFCGQETTKNGQPFKNHSALNTHINMHCSNKPAKVSNPNVTTICNHTYQLLNSNSVNPVVKAIIAAGHTKACKKCGDLQ
jgi:hypothetical protein